MKNKYYCILFLISLKSYILYAKPFSESLKDLNLLSDRYQNLNPIQGFYWVAGGVLENYGELSRKSTDEYPNELKDLANSLFHRVDEYKPSILGNNPSFYLSPRLIGKILASLESVRSSSELEEIFYADEEVIRMISENRSLACYTLDEEKKAVNRMLDDDSKLKSKPFSKRLSAIQKSYQNHKEYTPFDLYISDQKNFDF